MPDTLPVKFLIISDTHCAPLAAAGSPYAFRNPMPKCDVLLHAGDLTSYGGLDEYQETLDMLAQIDAELKLVIAGNHDLSLDENYHDLYLRREQEEKLQQNAQNMWKGPDAQKAGVTYLDEGMYHFTLKSGAKFSIYASPYTPEFCNWAFPYGKNEDRFNPKGSRKEQHIQNIAVTPVPDFPNVDIVMTHGPPENNLSLTNHGVDAGCPNLLHAVRRAKPRLHCFGHIHEGWGAEILEWQDDTKAPEEVLMLKVRPSVSRGQKADAEYIDIRSSSETPVNHGKRTLIVNAAIMNVMCKPVNPPWIVEMDLPTA